MQLLRKSFSIKSNSLPAKRSRALPVRGSHWPDQACFSCNFRCRPLLVIAALSIAALPVSESYAITIDSLARTVEGEIITTDDSLVSGGTTSSSSLGLFNVTESAAFADGSAIGSQNSTISKVGGELDVSGTGSAYADKTNYASIDDPVLRYLSRSILDLDFTVGTDATYAVSNGNLNAGFSDATSSLILHDSTAASDVFNFAGTYKGTITDAGSLSAGHSYSLIVRADVDHSTDVLLFTRSSDWGFIFHVAEIPEPATFSLAALGLLGSNCRRRRREKLPTV